MTLFFHRRTLAAFFGFLGCIATEDAPADATAARPAPVATAETPVPRASPASGQADATPPAPPAQVAVSEEPKVDPRTDPPKLDRSGDRYRVISPAPIEEVVVTPHGVALLKWGELWNVRVETDTVEKIAFATDLHAPASDERALYWLGRFGNGRYNYRTRKKGHLRTFAGLGRQNGLVIGDAPYGLAENGAVWRIGKRDNHRVNAPRKNWRSGVEVLAGDEVVVLSVFDDTELARYYWRVVRGKGERLEIGLPCVKCIDLDAQGRLLFVHEGEVKLLGPRSKTPKTLFETSDTSALCWCGHDMCTASEVAGELRHHKRTRSDYTVVATDIGPAARLSCNRKFVTWRGHSDELPTVHVVPLRSHGRNK